MQGKLGIYLISPPSTFIIDVLVVSEPKKLHPWLYVQLIFSNDNMALPIYTN